MLLATKITEEQRLQKCVVDIMRHPRYMWSAGVLMLGKLEVVEDIPTARTNGVDVQFGRAFIQSLTDAQLRFVLLHELYHNCLLYTSPSPRDGLLSRMPSSA